MGGPIPRGEWLGIAIITLAYLAVAALSILRPPLGWDESVYALRARDFADGVEPLRYWSDYRAPGLPWLGQFFLVAGREATFLRLLVAAFGLALVLVTWLVGRHLFGGRAGILAAAGTAVAPPLVLAATQVWPDVPGAALGLLAIGLFLFSTAGDRPSWWMVSLVPVVAAATYLRFGAPLPIALGLVVAAFWRRRVLLHGLGPPIATAVAATGVVVAVLEVPALTGSSVRPLTAIIAQSGGWFSGFRGAAPLVQDIVGPAAVALGLVGLLAAAAFAARGAVDRGALAAATAIGLLTTLGIAVVLHAEVRYLAPAYPWLMIAAAPGWERLASLLPSRLRPGLALVLAVLAVAAVGTAQERNREQSREYGALRRAAEAVGELAGGRPCVVVTRRVPQVMWYSGCDAVGFDPQKVRLPPPRAGLRLLLFYEGDRFEPTGELRAAYLATAGEAVIEEQGDRDVLVYPVQDEAAG